MATGVDASPGEVAERLFEKLVTQLSNANSVKTADPGKRLFFPDGIQLIVFKVTVSGFTVEIRIAGEKAPPGLMIEAGETAAVG